MEGRAALTGAFGDAYFQLRCVVVEEGQNQGFVWFWAGLMSLGKWH